MNATFRRGVERASVARNLSLLSRDVVILYERNTLKGGRGVRGSFLYMTLFLCIFLKKNIFLPMKEPFHFDVRRYNRALVLSLTFVAALLLSRELDNMGRSRRHTI